MQNTTLKKAFGLACLTLTLALSAAFSTNTHAAASDYTDDELVWSDEFSGTTLNTDNWTYEIGNGNWGWGNDEKEYYTDRQDNVAIADISADTTSNSEDDRALAIIAKPEYYGGQAYTSGRIKTAQKQSFKYGRVEAKIKMDNGMKKGIWPAFWMLGQNIDSVSWPACGEIDIMEHANADRYISGTVHWQNASGSHSYNGGRRGYGSANGIDDWHVYAIEWNETSITWYLDDFAYYTKEFDSSMSELKQEYFILLNVAVGGNFIGNQVPDSTWTHTVMYVDYVRVYQDKDAASDSSYSGSWTKDPIWNKCNVTFYDEDKTTTVLSGSLYKGQYLTPITHTKAGYDFVGWCTADGNLFDFSKPVNVDELKLYAKFQVATTVAPTTAAPETTTAAKVTKPNKPTISSLKSKAKRKVTIKIKVKGNAKGFQIKYGTNKKVTKNVKNKIIKKKTYTFKKLKSQKTYYFKARAYKLNANGKKVYGKWSKAKKVKVK